jgi:MarR family transcriptional regulator for hemolysin
VPPPLHEPIGLQVTRTAKVLGRAFAAVLAAEGGSLPVWLVLVSVKAGGHPRQRDLADAVGVEGPTLTHHLNRMEAEGLLRRTRDPINRRNQQVQLTAEGDAAFERLRQAAASFDRRLRSQLTPDEVALLGDLLGRLRVAATVEEHRP